MSTDPGMLTARVLGDKLLSASTEYRSKAIVKNDDDDVTPLRRTEYEMMYGCGVVGHGLNF